MRNERILYSSYALCARGGGRIWLQPVRGARCGHMYREASTRVNSTHVVKGVVNENVQWRVAVIGQPETRS